MAPKQVIADDAFLQHARLPCQLDHSLPLRLQKRELLRKLGFPEDRQLLLCSAHDAEGVARAMERYGESGYPFIIITSEKAAETVIPPLFEVLEPDKVQWRDNQGVWRSLSRQQTLDQIALLTQPTWLEFARSIWSPDTLAGRIIYYDRRRQLIELQGGVEPAKLLSTTEFPVFVVEIEALQFDRRDYMVARAALSAAGFDKFISYRTVAAVYDTLTGFMPSLERLRMISPLPTLEFAILRDNTFVAIDIDWPSQWIDRKV